jgi:transposase
VPAPLRARMIFGEERAAIEQVARSRTASARAVERARIVVLSRSGERVEASERTVGVCPATVRLWLNRFNRDGIKGLADRPRSGRPAVSSPAPVGEAVATSLTAPQTLGLPFASWTLDRLTAYLKEEETLPIKRSRIGEVLVAEG